MAKKNVQPTNDEVEVIVPDVQETKVESKGKTKEDKKVSNKANSNKENKPQQKNTKDDASKKKDTKNNKVKAKNNKQKAEKKSLKKRANEIVSELKKVSKPTFGTVVKNTGVVIVVVAICTLLLFGMDKLFSLIYNLLLS